MPTATVTSPLPMGICLRAHPVVLTCKTLAWGVCLPCLVSVPQAGFHLSSPDKQPLDGPWVQILVVLARLGEVADSIQTVLVQGRTIADPETNAGVGRVVDLARHPVPAGADLRLVVVDGVTELLVLLPSDLGRQFKGEASDRMRTLMQLQVAAPGSSTTSEAI